MINIIIYTISFFIGTFLGSFCTLAVYRIPLKQDITHERSYCPTCKHRLAFWDLVPLFSYIFLKGKCRYCGEKVRIRYLLLEIMFGLTYVLFIMSINPNFLNMTLDNLVYIFVGTLYLVSLFLIAGIDKERININREVLVFCIITVFSYIVYLYVVHANIYRYVIYMFIAIILAIMGYTNDYKKTNKKYVLQIISIIALMLIFSGEIVVLCTLICTVANLLIVSLINKFCKKNQKQITVGFYLCIYNILFLIILNFFIRLGCV